MVETVKDRCEDDKWSREAIECFAAVRTPAQIKPCNDKLTKDQDAAMQRAVQQVIAGDAAKVDPRMQKADGEMDALLDAIPKARAAHPDAACPAIPELLVINPNLSELDPWQQPYRIQCGEGVPGGTVMIWSAGPDHAFETADDLHVVR